MKEVLIVDAVRTPIGRYAGALKGERPDDLAALCISELLKRNPKLDPAAIEDLVLGCANQAGEDNRNVARMSALLAGLPVSVAASTVNRLCASGLEAIVQAGRAIEIGDAAICIAGGVESMSRAPFVMAKSESAFARDPKIYDTTLGWRFTNPKLAAMHQPYSMGETAENVAEKYGISRERQDELALASQLNYGKAQKQDIFKDEIVPVSIAQKKGEPKIVSEDEHPRPETTISDLQKLKPAFREGGSVTAGNSSGINDGACAVLLVSAAQAEKNGFEPLARLRAAAVAGVDPAYMGIGPVPAVRKVLERAAVKLDDVGLIELNEAFAAQVLASCDELGINPYEGRLNVNGGAIALGHPLGMSGARLVGAVIRQMKRQKSRYGIATMCIGVGQGMAALFELV